VAFIGKMRQSAGHIIFFNVNDKITYKQRIKLQLQLEIKLITKKRTKPNN